MKNKNKLDHVYIGKVSNNQIEENINFLNKLIILQQNFDRNIPYNPSLYPKNDARNFELLKEVENIFIEFNHINDKLVYLYEKIDSLRKELREKTVTIKIEYLEDIIKIFPFELDFRISSRVYQSYDRLEFNILFGVKDFPYLTSLNKKILDNYLNRLDTLEIFKSLNNSDYVLSRSIKHLADTKEYIEAKNELDKLKYYLVYLKDNGFRAYLDLEDIRNKYIKLKFRLLTK